MYRYAEKNPIIKWQNYCLQTHPNYAKYLFEKIGIVTYLRVLVHY